jgi:hypothetical protein
VKSLLARSSFLFVASVTFATLVACGSGSDSATPKPDAAATPEADAGATGSTPGTTVGTCYPSVGFAGNAKNVGAYCSPNAGQCSTYPGAATLLCSADVAPPGSPPGDFCVLVGCTTSADCGEDACCTGDTPTSPKACVPIGCFDGGVCVAVSNQ